MSRLFAIFAALLLTVPVFAQYRDARWDDLNDSEPVTAMKSHVGYLSSALLEGRAPGSEGEKMAAQYMEDTFRSYGVDVVSPSGGDVFGLKNESGDTLTSRNVVAVVPGYDKTLRNKFIVVGARMDNIGTVDVTVDGQAVRRIYYGANGNASGLAIMLELARMVQTNSVLFRRSVVFVAFGASTMTFAGSWYFLNRTFAEDAGNIDAMVNLDILGRGNSGFYAYTASNGDLNTQLKILTGSLQPVQPTPTSQETYPSDYRTFYAAEIPSVTFTTGRYREHNSEADTPSGLDYDMMESELEYIYNYTVTIANNEKAPLFRNDEVREKLPVREGVVAYHDADVKPMFLNNQDPSVFLTKWVYQYLKYPEIAVMNGVQGRVLVQFTIEKNGKVTDVHVVRGVSDELDAEAVKVIAASPKWRPGRVNGNKVAVSMTVPVEFKLEKKGKTSFGYKRHQY